MLLNLHVASCLPKEQACSAPLTVQGNLGLQPTPKSKCQVPTAWKALNTPLHGYVWTGDVGRGLDYTLISIHHSSLGRASSLLLRRGIEARCSSHTPWDTSLLCLYLYVRALHWCCAGTGPGKLHGQQLTILQPPASSWGPERCKPYHTAW